MSELASYNFTIFDSYTEDIKRLFVESANKVNILRGDLLFTGGIAYRQKIDSACVSLACESLNLIQKSMEEIIFAKKLAIEGFKSFRLEIQRDDSNFDKYDLLSSNIKNNLLELVNKTQRKVDKTKILVIYGKRQSIAKIAYVIAEILESRYPEINRNFSELKRLIEVFLDNIRRELDYLKRYGMQGEVFTRVPMERRPLEYEEEDDDITLPDLPGQVNRKSTNSKKSNKTKKTNTDLEEEDIENEEEEEEGERNSQKEHRGLPRDTVGSILEMFTDINEDEDVEEPPILGERLAKMNDTLFSPSEHRQAISKLDYIKKGRAIVNDKNKTPKQRSKATKSIKKNKRDLVNIITNMNAQAFDF